MSEYLCQFCPTSFHSAEHRDTHEALAHSVELMERRVRVEPQPIPSDGGEKTEGRAQPKGYSRGDAYDRLEQQLVSWAKNPDSAKVSVVLGDLRQVMSDAEAQLPRAT